jgi:hypothetical protein
MKRGRDVRFEVNIIPFEMKASPGGSSADGLDIGNLARVNSPGI